MYSCHPDSLRKLLLSIMTVSLRTTLLVLPGLDGTDVFFRPFLALLPDTIRPMVVSFPDRGPTGYKDLLGIARHAIAEIPQLYVLGSSFSGPLAVMLAVAEPQKVRGIILSATFLRSPLRMRSWFRFAASGPVIWVLRAARRIPVWALKDRNDPFRQAKAETWSRVSAHALAARLRGVIEVDVRDKFRACRQPVACIAFDNDRVVPRNSTEDILTNRPSVKLVTLPGDHFAFYADPARFAKAIVEFVHDVESR
jgi:pimeloyl-ACP methyl ester carboxylesterase